MAQGAYLGVPSTLPSGYTQLDYIQSSGTQYIDTGFTPNQDTRVICEFTPTDISTDYQSLFGYRDFYGTFLLPSSIRADYFGTWNTGAWSPSTSQTYVIDKNKNSTYLNGASFITSSYNTSQICEALYLFANNNAGPALYFTSAKLYSCKIYDNGTLARNFVPCKNSSNTVGLYDLVSAAFYPNAGTGTFTAGPVVAAESSEVARKISAMYCGVDGVARQVTKGYVGVDGVARQFWASDIDPVEVWKNAVLIAKAGRNGMKTGYVNISTSSLTANPCYLFSFCGTGIAIYKWKNSSLTRLFCFQPNVQNSPYLLIYSSNVTIGQTESDRLAVCGGSIFAFSFPGYSEDALDALFTNTVRKNQMGFNSSSYSSVRIASSTFSDGDFVISSMATSTTVANMAVNVRTGQATTNTLYLNNSGFSTSMLCINSDYWYVEINAGQIPEGNGSIFALSWTA